MAASSQQGEVSMSQAHLYKDSLEFHIPKRNLDEMDTQPVDDWDEVELDSSPPAKAHETYRK